MTGHAAGRFDVAVIGAGAAGMMAAAVAGQRGRKVVLIDHAARLAEKIRISGGGRCNFTNLHVTPANFISENPHFCRSALARYTPADFIALVRRHGIAFHEKHRGQLFCDGSSEQIIRMLQAECAQGGVTWRRPCKVHDVQRDTSSFRIGTDAGALHAGQLIVATGGLSIPKIGATDFAYRLARKFGVPVIEPRPALVPLTFSPDIWKPFAPLAGVALEVDIATGHDRTQRAARPAAGLPAARFREDLLFTHRGLSGPAVLQISSYWQPGQPLIIDLCPEADLEQELRAMKAASRQNLANALAQWLPKSLAQGWLDCHGDGQNGFRAAAQARLADLPDRLLRALADSLKKWTLTPDDTEGWRKAEVTRGGVDTRILSQQSMQVEAVPGLYFIGEAVDVTGWLGGYNFQWAWASAQAAGRAV